ncbi:uncharacterized protein LOC129596327 [Paramacrobiotus metropolitanus]|uniref:uncharacterized protein LOC129596327 n=1 Tax=Paramacrobiotus metropolitanus TaxID=2943436 RepID=UPI0024465D75|nr:uncharacterized protein LOC129596327 [Paramacrobiotus metropolitanus]XP_055349543.1 uncharacterized protein LOC129596327 [Paramacrobiotus metropolitanus]
MGKYRKTFGYTLNRDHGWAYQEIIAEAMIVLWFALQIALKFGTRFFPEWQNTRLDPDYKTGLGSLLGNLGYKMNGCTWDGIVSAWLPPKADAVTDNESTAIPAANQLRGRLGYFAVIITICAAVLLSVSVGCSLFVNRDWRYRPWTQHLHWCGRHPILTWLRRLPTWLKCIGFGVYFVVVFIRTVICLLVWLVLWVLPVVLMGGATTAVAIETFGLEAVFPCCGLLVSILSIYCTGRMWGLWMEETYFSWINNKLRRMCGTALARDSVAMEKAPLATAEMKSRTTAQKKMILEKLFHRYCAALLFKLSFFLCWWCALMHNIGPLTDFLPASDGSWDWWILYISNHKIKGNRTAGAYCIEYATGMMGVPRAVLSYWVDLDYPRWNTSHPALLSLFSTTYSPITYEVLRGWIWALSVLPIASVTVALVYWARGFRSLQQSCDDQNKDSTPEPGEIEAGRDEKPQETVVGDSTGTNNSDTSGCLADTAIPLENTLTGPSKPFLCSCPLDVGLIASIAVMVRRSACIFYLPYPLVQVLVAEPLQVWALLLLLTVYAAWLCWQRLWDLLALRKETASISSCDVETALPLTGCECWRLEAISWAM